MKPGPTKREVFLARQMFEAVKEEIREKHVINLLAEHRDELLMRVATNTLDPEEREWFEFVKDAARGLR